MHVLVSQPLPGVVRLQIINMIAILKGYCVYFTPDGQQIPNAAVFSCDTGGSAGSVMGNMN